MKNGKNKNGLPMKWVYTQPFHGGQYEFDYSHFGMGSHNSSIFVGLYPANRSDFHQSYDRLDFVLRVLRMPLKTLLKCAKVYYNIHAIIGLAIQLLHIIDESWSKWARKDMLVAGFPFKIRKVYTTIFERMRNENKTRVCFEGEISKRLPPFERDTQLVAK